MKAISIILIIIGAVGVIMSFMMFGDIGVAAFIGSATALLSGFGFMQVNKALNQKAKD